MNTVRSWISEHPNLWEFILFNILSNCATMTNFIIMWLGTGLIFRSLSDRPFRFLIFHYTDVQNDMGLCGFLSFLIAAACAQMMNFFVQKNLVFRSTAKFGQAVPKYIVLAIVLVIISTALPAYSQAFLAKIGILQGMVPTIANVINIIVQVALSYPAMKFWIMPG